MGKSCAIGYVKQQRWIAAGVKRIGSHRGVPGCAVTNLYL